MRNQGQVRRSIAVALACAAVERENGLKGQARKWLRIARYERWCPYHKEFDVLPEMSK